MVFSFLGTSTGLQEGVTVMRTIVILQLILLVQFIQPASAIDVMTLKSFLKVNLGGKGKIVREKFKLSNAQKGSLKKIAPNPLVEEFTFYYAKKDKKIVESCSAVPQKGKEGPLLIAVCYDKNGVIKKVNILSHEEERGKPIQGEDFLKQFEGKKASGEFVLGRDVDGISGATRSSRAISEALRRVSFGFNELVKPKL